MDAYSPFLSMINLLGIWSDLTFYLYFKFFEQLGRIFLISLFPIEFSIRVFLQEGENKFSIFVHSRPGFLFNKATTRSTYFLNRQVNDSIQVTILIMEYEI